MNPETRDIITAWFAINMVEAVVDWGGAHPDDFYEFLDSLVGDAPYEQCPHCAKYGRNCLSEHHEI